MRSNVISELRKTLLSHFYVCESAG
jgi:hypothetical protein